MRRFLVFGSLLAALFLSITEPGCDCGAGVHHGGRDMGVGPDVDMSVTPHDDGGSTGIDSGMPLHDDAGYLRSCLPDSPDLEGCGCTVGDAPRACWPYMQDTRNRGLGQCVDGMQTCTMAGEFAAWSACNGATTPLPEACTNGLDDSCDGLVDCDDPTCAADPACITEHCTDGETRPCYDGPDGTVGVGTCRPGTQTCFETMWSPDCPGEVLPAAEDCTGPTDANCNHLAGCFDLFACIASPACMEHCTMPLDPGCVCPDGSGDVATCPRGMTARTMGTIGGSIECCPCAASDCGSGTNCCQEAVCTGSAWCAGLYCPPLPSSCMGRVSADCDDFPEDCDEPCCECYGDCSGA